MREEDGDPQLQVYQGELHRHWIALLSLWLMKILNSSANESALGILNLKGFYVRWYHTS